MTDEDIKELLRYAVQKAYKECAEHYTLKIMREAVADAVIEERNRCIDIIENYKIHVGGSSAGEIACELTYMALRDIRDQIKGVKDDE